MGLRGRSTVESTSQIFFVTTSTFHHEKVFGLGRPYCNILIESLRFVLVEHKARLMAYVIMPSHIHFVIAMPVGEHISDLMRDFKKFTSTKIRQQLEQNGEQSRLERLRTNALGKKNQVFKLWQDRFDDLVLDNEKTLITKIEYIHNNPVKAGLVEEAEQWEFSSAGNYEGSAHSHLDVVTNWQFD